MNLVIDVGNTLIKTAVFQGDKIIKKRTALKQEFLKNIEEILQAHPKITHAIISSVVKSTSKWEQKLREKVEVKNLHQDLPQLFTNKYATPATLGQDRIALVTAAAKLYPNQDVLVIDAGSCVTYDFKNAKNEYYGGAISPGLSMRYKAMNTFTEKLPLLEPEEEVSLIGNSTRNSMHSGAIIGLAAEMDGMIAEYRAQSEELTVILTGGDAQFFGKRLKNSIFANSNFLLQGLNFILEFNKPQ